MARYLLDTDAIIDVLRNVVTTIRFIDDALEQEHELVTCDVVLAEAHSGIPLRESARADAFLMALTFLQSTPDIGRRAGQWRFAFARQGMTLATPDALIAATAVEYGATLVTRNLRDFPMPEVTILPPPRATGASSSKGERAAESDRRSR